MSLAIIKEPSECLYAPCYCEENVWHLCDYIRRNNTVRLKDALVVFISNESKTIPLWQQKAGDVENGGLICWDYHVILLLNDLHKWLVYDLDSTHPFPCDFSHYFNGTIRDDEILNIRLKYRRYFRIVSAKLYLELFSSDRSHMIKDGSWLHAPPHWPPITTSSNTLQEFWNTTSSELLDPVSRIMTTTQLKANFCKQDTEPKNNCTV